tara:strand:+ start:1224 stop:2132 length:909 start_codon:yes stop_codon:yes gene_type:complete
MNNELESITSTKEYKNNQYNILILLVKFACITTGFYGGIMGIWTVVAGECKERGMLKKPTNENDNMSSSDETCDKYEENKKSIRNRTSTKNKIGTNTTLVFYIIFSILSVCASKKGPFEGKHIVGYCTSGVKTCHYIHKSGLDLTICNSNGDCDLSTLPNHPTCKPPKSGKSLDFEFGNGNTFCQDHGEIPYCSINMKINIFPNNWKLKFVPDAKNRFKLERTSAFLTEKGIKFKTFEFESTLVFEKNNDGTCKRSMIVSAMPTENMHKFFNEYMDTVSEVSSIFKFFRTIVIFAILIFLCG